MNHADQNHTLGWALITGGSSGIGLEFAYQLAAEGYNLVLASRDGDELLTTAEKLRIRYNVIVESMDIDLAATESIRQLSDRISDQSRPIEILINNAGFAVHDSLLAEDTNLQMSAFSVMAEAVLKLSNVASRIMVARGRGRIINVASTSAWLFAGNYSALKRWVVVYTESLALELKGTGVSSTVVCPAWVKTNFHKSGGISRPDLPSWLWVPAKTVVKAALMASLRGKSKIIPTLRWKVVIFIFRHCEPLTRFVSKRMVDNRIRELNQKHGQ